MSLIYLQYHNCEQQGSLPHDFSQEPARLQIYTKLASAKKASGRVMLIVGLGHPRRFYLWSTFTIDRCQQKADGQILLEGPGWQLAPPQLLSGSDFVGFKASCANFIGFRQITELPFTKKLLQLAERHRPPGKPQEYLECLRTIQQTALSPKIQQQLTAQINQLEATQHRFSDEPTVALSIRQPHVEAIFRGIKKIEYRRDATSRRGRIHIYSAKLFADDLPHWVKKYGFEKVNLDELPRGVVVGSVELYRCDGGEWHLRHPVRAKTLRRPTGRPQPIWFTPFE
ncbi:MAG TPA: ASCH domain-containing protein [Gemmatales bacterium]|nr:ASCH domain-containing protein [Gemmatales bacterium]